MTAAALPRRRRSRAPLILVAGAGGLTLGTLGLGLLSVLILGSEATTASYGASAQAEREIPERYLALYQQAGQTYGLDWSVLAGIGKVESDHGRSREPGVRGGINPYGCCAGPMQFSIVGRPSTWSSYGVDGNGDGRRDVYDPADAIPAAARYLRASGAPADYRRALLAYNHAEWYVNDVLAWAARYRGQLLASPAPKGPPGPVVRVAAGARWLAPVPDAPGIECDARIVPDVEYLIRAWRLRVSACFAASGHKPAGEHPLGLAIDAEPADGDWSRIARMARALGWSARCAANGTSAAGCARPPFRFIGYNGYPGHGDPDHAGALAHIHLSWEHAPSPPLRAAAWVHVFTTAP